MLSIMSEWAIHRGEVETWRLSLVGYDPKNRAPADFLTPEDLIHRFGSADPAATSLEWVWEDENGRAATGSLDGAFLFSVRHRGRVPLGDVVRLMGKSLDASTVAALGYDAEIDAMPSGVGPAAPPFPAPKESRTRARKRPK
jgi:hypothetical protein